MPEKANIFWAEDFEPVVDALRPIIEDAGHIILYQPRSYDEASDAIQALIVGSIQVAIVDGNLSPRDSHGADGREIAYFLKLKDPKIFVIGNSSSKKGVDQTDLNILKNLTNPRPLLDAIRNAKYPAER